METATTRMAVGALLRCVGQSVRRWSLILGLGLLAVFAAPAVVGATPQPPPSFQDSAVGHGNTNGIFTNIDFNFVISPSGEILTHHSAVDVFGAHFEGTGPPDCASISGNTITVAGPQ